MSRRSSIWLAVAAAIVLVAAFLVVRRRGSTTPAVAAPIAPVPVSVSPTLAATPAGTADTAGTRSESAAEPDGGTAEPRVDEEHALPTWARAAIVVAVLLAFLAVSLIAKKA